MLRDSCRNKASIHCMGDRGGCAGGVRVRNLYALADTVGGDEGNRSAKNTP